MVVVVAAAAANHRGHCNVRANNSNVYMHACRHFVIVCVVIMQCRATIMYIIATTNHRHKITTSSSDAFKVEQQSQQLQEQSVATEKRYQRNEM